MNVYLDAYEVKTDLKHSLHCKSQAHQLDPSSSSQRQQRRLPDLPVDNRLFIILAARANLYKVSQIVCFWYDRRPYM